LSKPRLALTSPSEMLAEILGTAYYQSSAQRLRSESKKWLGTHTLRPNPESLVSYHRYGWKLHHDTRKQNHQHTKTTRENTQEQSDSTNPPQSSQITTHSHPNFQQEQS